MLFYTAGALVRALQPAHTPYAESFGIWKQNGLAQDARGIIQRAWQPYLDGRRDFHSAIELLVSALPDN
jgi:hypothetical protein